jgi:hypothetical protein
MTGSTATVPGSACITIFIEMYFYQDVGRLKARPVKSLDEVREKMNLRLGWGNQIFQSFLLS